MIKEVVGKVWRKLPRAFRVGLTRLSQNKFTVSVGAIVFDEEKRVLLLDHVLRPASGWGIPGGFIEIGEQVEKAIKREIYEETDLRLKDLEMIWVRTIHNHVEILFQAKAEGIAKVKSREIKEVGWFKVDELPTEMSETQKMIVNKVVRREF